MIEVGAAAMPGVGRMLIVSYIHDFSYIICTIGDVEGM